MPIKESISATHQLCQDLTTLIDEQLSAFFANLDEATKGPKAAVSINLNTQQLALLAALYPSKGKTKRLIVDGSSEKNTDLLTTISAWTMSAGIDDSWRILSGSLTPQEMNGSIVSNLSQTMHSFLAKPEDEKITHQIVPLSTLETLVPTPADYEQATLRLSTGEQLPQTKLIEKLISQGYQRHATTLDRGTFRVRGEQLDIQLPHQAGYVTVTLHGTSIENLVRHLGRRSHSIKHLAVVPVAFPQPTVALSQTFSADLVIRPQHLNELNGAVTIIYDSLASKYTFPLQSPPATGLGANLIHFGLVENIDRVTAEFFRRRYRNVKLCVSPLANSTVNLASSNLHLVSEAVLFPPTKSTGRPVSVKDAQRLIGQLTAGQPAVHADHGIGIYEGLATRALSGVPQEYLTLRYAAGDMLSVPVEYAHKVTAYLGETVPPLNRLGSTMWQKTRRRARHDAAAFAQELLQQAGKRSGQKRYRYTIDDALERQLEASFPFELTPDQLQTWHDIQNDLVSDSPMDRLVVGDVGFGKTEVAIRAAAHVANCGRQVAVLSPTTLLVQQHADTFTTRLAGQNQTVGVLSRFQSSANLRQLLPDLATGKISIVIGTQALLSKKVRWNNLGLVIIDEEQRFGVAQKEYFKKIRSTVDILSLSATPIPRTLSMSLSGLKDISIIATAPKDRKPTATYVGPDTEATLQAALIKEHQRGGQTYLVSPRIRDLNSLAKRVAKLAPRLKRAILHGQMPNQQLAETMAKFDHGEIDVLISSTIIENGLDLPNANTIIVTRATHFGLADLYQLRGRIGRRDRAGFAYFLYRQGQLTSDQRQRLTALTEATRPGSGWLIAQRDLQIRGAGNLLGAEQSGTVNAVGVQFYLDLVHEEVSIAKREETRRHDVDVQLPLPALIPEHYIADPVTRTAVYQHLARASTAAQLKLEYDKLVGQYGKPPTEVINLYYILGLQHAAAQLNISKIVSQRVTPPGEDAYWQIKLTT
ncbi:DEAD/DEAH box helicase, partial [Patescibacteria group bacterium]|nr:DEAD/DEAH box helicase [Patescibacteria group bacterium]